MEAVCAEKYSKEWEAFQQVANGACSMEWTEPAGMVVMLAGVDVAVDPDAVEKVYGSLALKKGSQMTFGSFLQTRGSVSTPEESLGAETAAAAAGEQ